MKKVYLFLLTGLLAGGLVAQELYKDIGSAEIYTGLKGKAVVTKASTVLYSQTSYLGDTLFFNGTSVNGPASGPGIPDSSILETSLGMNTLGAAHSLSSGFRMADDFSIAGAYVAGWHIDSVVFFAYQTGSTTTSTINHVNLRIWDGTPGIGTVVFGDSLTNRMVRTEWANMYRFSETTIGTTRPVMRNVVAVDFELPVGSYWLDWQTGGTLASGPWAPPIAIRGMTTTGDGLQYSPSTTSWGPFTDSGTLTGQGLPFVIYGHPVYIPLDYSVTEFVDLPSSFMAGGTYNIKARVQNFSSVTVTDVPVRFFVDGIQEGADQLITLDSLADSVVTFAWTPADEGNFTLKIQSFLPYDTMPANDYQETGVNVTPLMYILTHSLSDTVISGTSVACNNGGYHTQNSYWRSFVLDSFSVNTDMQVDSVLIGVEQALGNGGSQPAICNLYTSDAAFPGGTLTLIHSDTNIIMDQNLTLLKLNSTGVIPAGSELVVEIYLPDGVTPQNKFFIGANNMGQTAPSYISAADCGISTPTDLTGIGFPNMHIVMYVYGSIAVPVAVDEPVAQPKGYALYPNYPNPFNPTTTIRYDLRDAGKVTLKIYNTLGQEVRTLVNKNETAGFKSVVWDGRDNAGRMVSSGLYIYRIEAGKFVKSHKMMLLK